MANFNLGRIKGDKGDKGDTGPMGPAGAAGERGERGERGEDGITPVFSVGETVTLSASEEAYVDINTDDPHNPVLSFYIPKGSDGKDAHGDMQTSIYDTNGVNADFFQYADNLASSCLKISGGNLEGALKAAESHLEEGCVRNITVGEAFPENAANGDLCIIVKTENTKTLGECKTGDIMLIEELGGQAEYIVVAKDFHRENSVTLLRKKLPYYQEYYDYSIRGKYRMSNIDVLLETVYIQEFPEHLRKELLGVEVESHIFRHCFLLSYEELDEMEYFSTNESRKAVKEGSATAYPYYTRSCSNSKAYLITESGTTSSVSQSALNYFRPAIVLKSDLPVENTQNDSLPAVKLPDTKCGIYVCINGEWRECSYGNG